MSCLGIQLYRDNLSPMKKAIKYLLFVVFLSNCVEPYFPPTSDLNSHYLVIDAFLNGTSGSASVMISHTLPLYSTDEPAPEQGAVVTIQSDQGDVYILNPVSEALYSITGQDFSIEKNYQLHIRTAQNKEYVSSIVPLKFTPPIDSISWVINENVLELNVNTHDDTGGSVYYRWIVSETFEYVVPYPSSLIIENEIAVDRPDQLSIEKCWATEPLHHINIASSSHLSDDQISNFTVRMVDNADIRLSRKYSILIQQFSITEDAFFYWSNVKKTNETLGGLFDPMPGEVIGNIKCITDPNEPVIGFFSAALTDEKRRFITRDELPEDFVQFQHAHCEVDTIPPNWIRNIRDPDALISRAYRYEGGPPVFVGYTTSVASCRDCRKLAGGVTVKPDFWE
jgi:hypothetical protein